jgi:hypothetical protein
MARSARFRGRSWTSGLERFPASCAAQRNVKERPITDILLLGLSRFTYYVVQLVREYFDSRSHEK